MKLPVVVLLCLCWQEYAHADSLLGSSSRYDTQPPKISQWMPEPDVLIFSKTKGWRHNRGIASGDYFFVQLADKYGFNVFTTENGAVFNSKDLARFKVIVFNNVTGDVLSSSQQKAFKDWLENGGGWIGLHSSGDASMSDWTWYQNKLIGPGFTNHIADPQFQEARVETLNQVHPIMEGIPEKWLHTDEWYSFDGLPQDYGLMPLAGINESTYAPVNKLYGAVSDLRMGKGAINHPVMWSTCVDQGRAFYSALGHKDDAYENEVYRHILENSFKWMINRSGTDDLNGC